MKILNDIKFAIAAAVMMTAAASCTYRPYTTEESLFTVIPDPWDEMQPAYITFPGDTIPASFEKKIREGEPIEVSLWLRYNLEAPENVLLVATQETIAGDCQTDTLAFPLRRMDGTPDGKGGYALYETSRPLPGNLWQKQGWTLTIFPLDADKGFTEVGVIFSREK